MPRDKDVVALARFLSQHFTAAGWTDVDDADAISIIYQGLLSAKQLEERRPLTRLLRKRLTHAEGRI